ncbi:MAG: ABC transporter substrate-binding protein [Pseudomonadota bacterium]|jgi:peptide/nickel transport system substrate-binding protein|uniref:ABC transporter substrate-binding protein n=1 Tax=Burkholderiaceae TaxID=119060 RepID=UPI0010F8BCD2|nr:ABC transporter substrate-binding protein [Burkholderia sp. 4M9327F10]
MDRFGVASVAVRRLACGLLAGAALLAVPVILAGWPVRQALAAEPAGSQPEIRFAEGTDTPTSMPGNQSRNTSTDDILGHVVESLVALKNDMSIGPMLADSWTISPDGTTYTFRLRDGVLFHNGAPVTSAEVKWSFDYLMNPHSGFECRSVFSGQRGVKVLAVRTPDPRTVVFELDHPYALFLTQMANPRCPLAVLHPSSVDAQGHWLKPVATGPYVFSEWRKGQYVRLTPFAQYKPRPEPPDGMAGAKTAYAPLRFVTIPDAAAQKSALLSGQIDAMSIDEDDQPEPDPRWHEVAGPGAAPTLMLMQTRDPLLADPRMRRAIALAVDLRNVASAVSNGQASYNPSLVPTVDRLHDASDAAGYPFDLAEAKRLLNAAGYRGQTLRIEVNRRYPEMFRLGIYMQSLLSKAGIHAELDVVEWAKQLADFRSGKFQMMAFEYSSRLDPAQIYGDVLGDKSKTPMAQWENPAARALLRSIDGVSDPARRQQTFDQIHQLMIADTPMLVLFDSPNLWLVSSRLQGFQTWSLERVRFFNVKRVAPVQEASQ